MTDDEVRAEQRLRLDTAVTRGRELGRLALYFGCWRMAGHYLHDANGRHIYGDKRPPDLCWNDALMDTGLLENGRVKDEVTGRVFWTCGGATAFWHAFYWWDRSVDRRGKSNSGFYVRGFGGYEEQEAFDYACTVFPGVVARQARPLALQNVRLTWSKR